MATVYLAPDDFTGETAEVAGDLYHHLFRARRLAVGDRLRVVDGLGTGRLAKVASVGRGVAELELGAATSVASRTGVELVVAASRPERARWLVEKATELGVEAIHWLTTDRSQHRLNDSVLKRHRRIAIGAMQQSGGAFLPRIDGPHPWPELDRIVSGKRLLLVLDSSGERGLGALEASSPTVLIGPEGGWTTAELERLDALGYHRWSLGERTLRVETAAITALAVLASVHRP